MRRLASGLFAGAVLAAPAAAAAGETIDYVYDALGRLTDVAVEGGSNAGSAAATRYDPAGNRISYGVSGAGAAGAMAGSQSAAGDEAIGPIESEVAEEVERLAARVEPPPPGGIPDEAEPVVEIGIPDAGAAAAWEGNR